MADGYRQEGDRVVLTMTREDYNWLNFNLGVAAGLSERAGIASGTTEMINRINAGNPEWSPYIYKDTKKGPG